MKTLREYITWAEQEKIAIGHFNVATLEMVHAVIDALKIVREKTGKDIPVVLGVAEGEQDWMGIHEMSALVEEYRSQGLPVFLNADHTFTVERVQHAIDVGFDMVIFDGAKISYEDNVEKTKQVVAYARACGREILVEAELGYIGSGSDIKDSIPDGAGMMTSPEESKQFVEQTGVDLLAPSVGNIHGMVKGGNPHIDAELVKQIRETAGVPLVLHGGSGISDADITAGIKFGIGMIHVSTELRLAYRTALEESLSETTDLAPYKYLPKAHDAVRDVVVSKLELFIHYK
ncbi:MAG: class II fructose-bisphosphate aldolase [Candidatus Pacebacteria bacterium]|nr:class II fructose-bisphosphate aldolase [Candidatus Paceibacterota bacterium]